MLFNCHPKNCYDINNKKNAMLYIQNPPLQLCHTGTKKRQVHKHIEAQHDTIHQSSTHTDQKDADPVLFDFQKQMLVEPFDEQILGTKPRYNH